MAAANDDSHLPGILCLHGYGTNASILRYQLRSITAPLRGHFRFVFLDGPFEVVNPGPGVPASFAADARPFRRWHSDKTLSSIFGVSPETLRDERLQVRALLQDTLEREKTTPSSPGQEEPGSRPGVIGVMAFSQGAGLAAALCLDPELGKDIKFAVIICALYPAVSLSEDDENTEKNMIDIPSIHVQGTLDTWRGQGTKVLEEYFVRGKVKRIEFRMGHEVPGKPKDAGIVADETLAIWKGVQDGL